MLTYVLGDERVKCHVTMAACIVHGSHNATKDCSAEIYLPPCFFLGSHLLHDRFYPSEQKFQLDDTGLELAGYSVCHSPPKSQFRLGHFHNILFDMLSGD